MQHDVLIDGVEADGIWLKERAFQFGDGLFETVAIIDGEPCLWDAHMARLRLGCLRLHLPFPDFSRLAEEGRRLCAGYSRAVLKIFWTAGRSERGYRRPVVLNPKRVLRRSEWLPSAPRWSLRQCSHRLGENPALAGVKHLNRLDQVLARAEWVDANIDEGLTLGQDDRVVCGTMSNIFVQRDLTLLTPAVDMAGIAGVVRSLVLETGDAIGNPVQVGSVSLDDVRKADAVFLTNSLIGVVRARRFESYDYNPDVSEHAAIVQVRRHCHRPKAWGVDSE